MKRVKIPWNAIPRSTAYEVQYREVGAMVWSAVQTVATNSIILLLQIGKEYQVRVRSVCGNEMSDWAYLGVNVYSSSGTCITPAGITIEQAPNTYNFTISWGSAANVSGWNFRYRKEGDLVWISSITNVNSIVLSGLVIGATYEYQVQSICVSGSVSNWSNPGVFVVRSTNESQVCPVSIQEDWTATVPVVARKNSSSTVSLTGALKYTGPILPAEGDFVTATVIDSCCAPNQDVILPVDNLQFKGQVTISSSGQVIVYIEQYKGTPNVTYSFSDLFYEGFIALCPPPVPPQPSVTGTLTFTLPNINQGGAPATMNVIFNTALLQGVSFKWGLCAQNTSGPLPEYCAGWPAIEPGNAAYAAIGIGASTFTQQSGANYPGLSYGLITKVVLWDITGIASDKLQLAVGQNYQLIIL